MVRRETDGSALRPSAKPSAEFSEYDQDAFLQRFGRQLDDQEAEINLVLDGIHCAACIWLIEKLPRILPGVSGSQIELGQANGNDSLGSKPCVAISDCGLLEPVGVSTSPGS